MSIRSLPEYVSNKPMYVHLTGKQAMQHLENTMPSRVAIDTETCYVEHLPGAITKFIKGSKNNMPFGVSLYWVIQGVPCVGFGVWVTEGIDELEPMFRDTSIEKVFHNFKFDVFMLTNIGITVAPPYHDTMVLIQLIDEEFECKTPPSEQHPNGSKKRSKKLKDLAYHFLGADAHELEDMVGEYRKIISQNKGIKKDDVSYLDVALENQELMCDYAIADTEFTYKLFEILYPLMLEQDLSRAYELDINATLAVMEIERQGFRVDVELMKKDEAYLQTIKAACIENCCNVVGKEFNLDSDHDLVLAFESFMMKPWEFRTETGEYSTDKHTLNIVANDPNSCQRAVFLATEILRYRQVSKLLSTYITGVYDFVQDSKVHCDYWISPSDYGTGGTKTGRLSSSNPNLQNVSGKDVTVEDTATGTVLELNVKDYYIAEPDCVLIDFDYSAQEYRLLGHYGQDKSFMQFIADGKDIHKATASLLFKKDYEDVTKEERQKAKTANFGSVYGLGNAALANSLGYSIDEGRMRNGTTVLYKTFKPWKIPPYCKDNKDSDLIGLGSTDIEQDGIRYFLSDEVQSAVKYAADFKKSYFAQFPGNKEFIDTCSKAAQERGYVRTWSGRRRHFKNPKQEGYKAPNAVIQGSCGCILKSKLWELVNFLKPYKSRIVNNVHDSVVLNVHKDELDLIDTVKMILEDLPFRVPITCGCEYGTRWGSKTAYTTQDALREDLGW